MERLMEVTSGRTSSHCCMYLGKQTIRCVRQSASAGSCVGSSQRSSAAAAPDGRPHLIPVDQRDRIFLEALQEVFAGAC
eukprot:scaffold2908_cov257-Pinguiococcus_pyrenoidosus.AAC.25